MSESRNAISLGIDVSVPKDLISESKILKQALDILDKLYLTQLEGRAAGSITRASENRAWAQIISILSEVKDTLPDDRALEFSESLKVLKGGIYDLYPIYVPSSSPSAVGVEIVLGKVFLSSGGGEAYYSGTAGACNTNFDKLIKAYDSSLPALANSLSSKSRSGAIEPPGNIPELKCLDVFSLSGGLNGSHKPICVFFSGGERENVSSLSNMTVFINLYEGRFRAVTLKIAERYIPYAWDTLKDLEPDDISRLLLIWLRGHDVGHFFGEDVLGTQMSEFDMDYMILHELKSDFISLYNLKYLGEDILGDLTLEQAYMVSLAEMLRYIRRGGIYKHPDSGSAYLTAIALMKAGAFSIDEASGEITFDVERIQQAIEMCTIELIDLFASGSADEARAYVHRSGDLSDTDEFGIPRSCPDMLLRIIEDKEIPYAIDYKFSF